jgi:hypothetical protein
MKAGYLGRRICQGSNQPGTGREFAEISNLGIVTGKYWSCQTPCSNPLVGMRILSNHQANQELNHSNFQVHSNVTRAL